MRERAPSLEGLLSFVPSARLVGFTRDDRIQAKAAVRDLLPHVAFPVDEQRVVHAERELRRRLPTELRDRLTRENGGEITAMPIRDDEKSNTFDPYWDLHPVWDDSDGRRAARSTSHIVRETAEARAWPDFPEDAIPFASNGTADRLVVMPDSDDFLYWNHEDGSTLAVRVWWD
jgi:cell wall assembly regulator SMI1